jgi:hypothetical protein
MVQQPRPQRIFFKLSRWRILDTSTVSGQNTNPLSWKMFLIRISKHQGTTTKPQALTKHKLLFHFPKIAKNLQILPKNGKNLTKSAKILEVMPKMNKYCQNSCY